MKNLKNYKSLNESWIHDVKRGIKFDREDDILMYLIELVDIGWTNLPANEEIGGSNFDLNSRMTYVTNSLYPIYFMTFENYKHKDNEIEIMEIITSAMERMKDEGLFIRIIDLTLGKDHHKDRFRIAVYHEEDKIDWKKIFIKGDKY